MENKNKMPVPNKAVTGDEKKKVVKPNTGTPIEPYKGNSKIKEHSRLTASGLKPE